MSDYQHIGIERTENGYVVQMPGSKLAFEKPEFADLSPEPHTTARMLRAVVEYFGAAGTRYDAQRVRVVVEPGDKREDGEWGPGTIVGGK